MEDKQNHSQLNVKIFGNRGLLTGNIKSYALRRITYALDRFHSAVREVNIRLLDVNGPKGGIDKNCIANVVLIKGEVITIHSEDSDLYRAIDEMSQKAKQALSRRKKKSYNE